MFVQPRELPKRLYNPKALSNRAALFGGMIRTHQCGSGWLAGRGVRRIHRRIAWRTRPDYIVRWQFGGNFTQCCVWSAALSCRRCLSSQCAYLVRLGRYVTRLPNSYCRPFLLHLNFLSNFKNFSFLKEEKRDERTCCGTARKR